MSNSLLLLDINDTFDSNSEGSNYEIGSRNHIFGINQPREGIRQFGDFLNDTKEKIIPIFWTSVGLEGQSVLAKSYLKADVYGFDGKNFIQNIGNTQQTFQDSIGLSTPKYIYIKNLKEQFKGSFSQILWFEDYLDSEDKEFVNENTGIHHVGITHEEFLINKIKRIKELV